MANVGTALNEVEAEHSTTNQTIVPSVASSDAPPTPEQTDSTSIDDTAPSPREPVSSSPKQPDGPQWANARDAVQQGDVRIKVTSVKVDFAEVQSFGDPSKSEEKLLLIRLHVDNLSDARKLDFRGFAGNQFDFSGDSKPNLEDDLGNIYKRINFGATSRIVGQVQSESVYPGKSIDDLLVFEVPVEKAKSLRLELPASAFGGEGKLRIAIPAETVER